MAEFQKTPEVHLHPKQKTGGASIARAIVFSSCVAGLIACDVVHDGTLALVLGIFFFISFFGVVTD